MKTFSVQTFSVFENLGGELAQTYEQYAMAQNGVSTLLIDGQCRYWVNRSNLEGGVTGVLTGEEADDFARSVLMDEWKDFYGKLLGTACEDCASSEITNGERRFGYWPALDGLEDIETIAEAVRDYKNELFEKGSPLTGDLRCHLSQLSSAEAGTEYWETQPWQAVPEGLDLSAARPYLAADAPFDMASLIAETFLVKGAPTATLRDLRASLGERGGVYSSFIPSSTKTAGDFCCSQEMYCPLRIRMETSISARPMISSRRPRPSPPNPL